MSGLHRGGQGKRAALAAVIARDGPSCRRCRVPVDVTLSGNDPAGPTLGHIVPVALGGTDHLENLGLEHRRCNLAAGARRDPPRATIAIPNRIAER